MKLRIHYTLPLFKGGALADGSTIDTSVVRGIGDFLETKARYNTFRLTLYPDEVQALRTLTIRGHNSFDCFGSVDEIGVDISSKLYKLFDYTDSVLAQVLLVYNVIIRFITSVLKGCNKQHAWVSVRTSLPNHDFDIPRWHVDGRFFESSNTFQYKVVTTLLGSGTLVCNDDATERQNMLSILQKGYDYDEERLVLSTALQKCQKFQVAPLSGLVFRVGSELEAVIHSEPPVTEPRLFISIVTGTENEIKYIHQKRQRK